MVVREGQVDRPANQRLSAEDLVAGYALACQATIQSDATIHVPDQQIDRKLQTDKTAQRVAVPMGYDPVRDQPLRKVVVTVTPPSLDDQTDDWSRLKRELARQHEIKALTAELPVMKRLSAALREGEWTVTLVLEASRPGTPDSPLRLVDVQPGDRLETLWAAAIDIGTTTNVVWLVDMLSGEVMAQVADYNGQIARGEDVISRIIYASRGRGKGKGPGEDKGQGLIELQQLVVGTLNACWQRRRKRWGPAQTRSIGSLWRATAQ